LSAAAKAVASDADATYAALVVRGDGAPAGRQLLEKLTPDQLFDRPVRSPNDAKAALAGLWLWHDWLDRSHEISQSVATPTGSYWHAIMHRREGDFSNAKYWYARCRRHPVLEVIPVMAKPALGGVAETAPLHQMTDGAWDADAFVDVVEAVHRKPDDPLYNAAVKLQRLEWQALFAYSAKQAVGAE
jgi:hypothetical protein